MEAFRRIRSRRKSKGQSEAFATFENAESSYRSDSSPFQASTMRTSATGRRPSDVTVEAKVNHDHAQRAKSPTWYRRPGTSNRIQPMLVGLARPSMTSPKPGTAESMQRAPDRAAESVEYQPTRGLSSSSSQIGLRTGRYIDILATIGQTGKPTTTYNENVAERNLDAQPLKAEEQHSRHEPVSKLEEEVAARNAHQIAAHRTSSVRRSNTVERAEPFSNRSGSAQSGSYHYQVSLQPDVARSRHDQDATAYHSRQHSSRTREASQQLPAIPQERSSEDFELAAEEDVEHVRPEEKRINWARARWLASRQSSHRDEGPPDVDKPLPASPRQKDLSRHLGIPPYANAPSCVSERAEIRPKQKSKHDNIRDGRDDEDPRYVRPVQRPPPENPAPRQAMHASQVLRRDRAYGAPRELEYLRPLSTNSNPTYKRMDVGNRTIIDFTEDEASSPASYSQMPIVEDTSTSTDQSRGVFPTMVERSMSPRKPRTEVVSIGPDRSSTLEPVLDLNQLARRSRAISDHANAVTAVQGRHAQPEAVQRSNIPPPPALAFSPIKTPTSYFLPRSVAFSPVTTLTSTSPRSSQENLVDQSSSTAQTLSTQGVATRDQGQDDEYDVPDAYSGPRGKKRVSADITPLVKIFADIRPEDSGLITKSSRAGRPKDLGINSDRREEVSSSSKKEGKRRERSASAEIRRAAKSIIPAGPLDREPSPAIKTRDFAIVPVERPTNNWIEVPVGKKRSQLELKKVSREPSSSSKSSSGERKGRSHSTKSAHKVSFNDDPVSATLHPKPERRNSKRKPKSNSSALHKAIPKSLFDEEAFKKKHAEANAALLRLQESLQQTWELDTDLLVVTPDTEMTASRTLSPVDRTTQSISPVPQSSATAAAMAMIEFATSSPRPRSRQLYSKASSDLVQKYRSGLPTPVPRSNTEETMPAIRNTTLTASNPTFTRIDAINKPPLSPGEVSLSSFPIPTPRAISPESNETPPVYVKDIGPDVRSASQASRQSSASAFSIPFTMVPDRIGSLPENRTGVPPTLSTVSRVGSVGSIIPSS